MKRQRERDLKIEKKCERKKEVMKGNRERERLCKKERYKLKRDGLVLRVGNIMRGWVRKEQKND